jgi:hypothetical protein
MRTFRVYKHATEGFEAVKVGFSWPALFFGALWMLVSGLWLFAAAWLAMVVSLRIIEALVLRQQPSLAQAIAALVIAACFFALWLVPAFKGNRWRDRRLSKQGYQCVATIQARNPAAATAQAITAA